VEAPPAPPGKKGKFRETGTQGEDDGTDEGVARRPRIGRLELIGAEPPGTICVHCGQSGGNVYLIRHPRRVASEPLHEKCAPEFFDMWIKREDQ
jgi:hypothetical protein